MPDDEGLSQNDMASDERLALTMALESFDCDAVVVAADGRVVSRIAGTGPVIGTDWLALWNATDRGDIAEAMKSEVPDTITLRPRPEGTESSVRMWVRPRGGGDVLILTEKAQQEALTDAPAVRESLHKINNLITVFKASSRLVRRALPKESSDHMTRVLDETEQSAEDAHLAVQKLRRALGIGEHGSEGDTLQ